MIHSSIRAAVRTAIRDTSGSLPPVGSARYFSLQDAVLQTGYTVPSWYMAVGSSLEVEIVCLPVTPSYRVILADAAGTGIVTIGNTDVISLNGVVGSIDDEPIVSGTTPMPADGEMHTFVFTRAGWAGTVGFLGSRQDFTGGAGYIYSNMAMVPIDSELPRHYALGESPTEGTIANNLDATGATDGLRVNVPPTNVEEFTLSGSTWVNVSPEPQALPTTIEVVPNMPRRLLDDSGIVLRDEVGEPLQHELATEEDMLFTDYWQNKIAKLLTPYNVVSATDVPVVSLLVADQELRAGRYEFTVSFVSTNPDPNDSLYWHVTGTDGSPVFVTEPADITDVIPMSYSYQFDHGGGEFTAVLQMRKEDNEAEPITIGAAGIYLSRVG